MAPIPRNINPYEIENVLNEMFSPEWLRDTAAKVGYVQRNRKIDPVTFFWVVVLGFGVGMQRTLASLRRAYETASAETLVPSSFYGRFNNRLIVFLKECLAHGIADLVSHTSLTLSDKLKGFKDLVVADGTIIRLHDKLAEQFPGARGKAELKIHTATGITGNTKSIAIYSGKTAEIKTMRIGSWVKDNILLFDLGYFKYELFSRIRDNGGYFVSRLKQSANPTIVSVLRTHRDNTIDIAGKKLKDILPQLKQEVIDVEVEVSFKGNTSKIKKAKEDGSFEIYHPRVGTPKVKETFRLVGVFNKETKKYHLYLTNISPEQLTVEDVALLYRARWSVELLFKELKSLYQLDVISSGAPAVVESLVLVAMLTLVVSHRLLNHMRLLAPEKSTRFTPLRWAESFYAIAPVIMSRVLKAVGIDEDPFQLIIYFMGEGIDPNVNRERLLSPWVKAVNSQGINAMD
ncbi:MAG: IS4 family transposase [Desulfotomaculaceae bacterium]|nr:IS4 family transposase [Desulfotomaculaceae bacterium]